MLISKYGGVNVEDKIFETEKKYSIRLCEEYKKFLIKYNGGETPKTRLSGGVRTDIQKFYGFTEDINTNITEMINNGLGEGLIKQFELAIACNSFGDLFIIQCSEEKNGEISFLYHDNPQRKILVAPSFMEFISKCKSEKIGHIRTIEERKRDMIEAGRGDDITPIKLEWWQKEIDRYANIHQEKVIL